MGCAAGTGGTRSSRTPRSSEVFRGRVASARLRGGRRGAGRTGSVRNRTAGAWVTQGLFIWGIPDRLLRFAWELAPALTSSTTSGTSLGVTVWDLFYVGLTIVVSAVLLLIVKGIETFER